MSKVVLLLCCLGLLFTQSKAAVQYFSGASDYVTWSSQWANSAGLDYSLYKLDSRQAWSPGSADMYQWIQITSLQPRNWVAIVIQGRNDALSYVTAFKVEYTLDNILWLWANEGKQYAGVTDGTRKVRANFDRPIAARAIRVHPTAWYVWPSMRFNAIYSE